MSTISRRMVVGLVMTFLVIAGGVLALAQGGPPPDERPGTRRPPPPRDDQDRDGPGHRRGDGPHDDPLMGPTFNFISAEMRFNGPPIKGAPFSAVSSSEFTQTLADGTRITRKSTGTIARDNEGRTRREMELGSIGPFAAPSGPPPRVIIIDDPVAGFHYVLNPTDRVARQAPLPSDPPHPPGPPPSKFEAKTEALGKKTIEGVEVEGTRSTIAIPAGKIGNDRAIEIVSERWYSAELQAVILSTHKDPLHGETVYRLTGITRTEPAKSNFDIPADYTVEPDRRGPPRGRRHDGPHGE